MATIERWTGLLKQEAGVDDQLETSPSPRCADHTMGVNLEAALPSLQITREPDKKQKEGGEGNHLGCLLKGQFVALEHLGVRHLPKGSSTACTLQVPWHLPRVPRNPLLLRPVPYRQEEEAPNHLPQNRCFQNFQSLDSKLVN